MEGENNQNKDLLANGHSQLEQQRVQYEVKVKDIEPDGIFNQPPATILNLGEEKEEEEDYDWFPLPRGKWMEVPKKRRA